MIPTIGLYRHFKGAYYFVQNIVKDCTTNELCCYYFNVCKPEDGLFIRPVSEWFSTETSKGTISERLDNLTGQIHRFEKVSNLNFQLGSISTEQLISELSRRTDSPIHELDIEGLHSNIDCIDYVAGRQEAPNFINSFNVFETEGCAKRYMAVKNFSDKNIHLYKRTFIRVN